MASRAPAVVLAYDANCGPCSRFKAFVEFLAAPRRVKFTSLEAADESGLLAGVDPARRYASFHLIRRGGPSEDPEVWSGAEAVLPLIRTLSPWGRGIPRAVETIPGGGSAAAFAYSALSRLHRGCSVQRR